MVCCVNGPGAFFGTLRIDVLTIAKTNPFVSWPNIYGFLEQFLFVNSHEKIRCFFVQIL